MRSAPARLALAAVVVAAGCLSASTADPAYAVGGTFTKGVTVEEKAALGGWLRDTHGADLIVMESYPEPFQARDLTPDGCEDARAHLQGLDYVAEARECVRTDAAGDPRRPASASAS